jgi:hypothetical protein
MSTESTYGVTLWIGRRVAPLPFGRFEITNEHLAIYSWPRGHWIERQTIAKRDVEGIEVAYSVLTTRMRITDAAGRLANVVVEAGWRPDRIIENLRRTGYRVVDRWPIG